MQLDLNTAGTYSPCVQHGRTRSPGVLPRMTMPEPTHALSRPPFGHYHYQYQYQYDHRTVSSLDAPERATPILVIHSRPALVRGNPIDHERQWRQRAVAPAVHLEKCCPAKPARYSI